MKKLFTALFAAAVRRAPGGTARLLAASARAAVSRRDRGPAYRAARQEITGTEAFSAAEIQALQLKKLQEIVNYAWEHVPGYREHWRKDKFTPGQLRTLSDIRRIPPITKQQLRGDIDRFSAGHRGCKYITTSGSTGIPLGLYLDRAAEATELAFLHHMWQQRGFNPDGRSLIIRGAPVAGGYSSNPYAELTIFGDLLLSAYKITREAAPLYIDALNSFRPQCIQAYPSALAQLTRACAEAGLTVRQSALGCIILASEKLFDADKRLLQAFWKVPLVHYYGMTEKAVLAGPCRTSDLLHIYPQYGLAEVVKDDGSEAGDNETGQIIATSFFMRRTPFIRYHTGDLAVAGPTRCPECDRHYRLLREVIGRSGEFVLTADGRKVPFSMAIGSIHDSLFLQVEQFQFRQAAAGELICSYVGRTAMPPRQQQAIAAEIGAKVGPCLQVRFERVPAISQTANGKHSFFKREL